MTIFQIDRSNSLPLKERRLGRSRSIGGGIFAVAILILGAAFPHRVAAAADSSASAGQPTYHLSRLEQFDDPRHLALAVAVVVGALAAGVIWQYRRESGSLPARIAWLLGTLRLTALAGAVVFFLAPEKRTDRRITTESRVEILIDASQSMTIADEPSAEGSPAPRGTAAAALVAGSPLVADLRKSHEVRVRAFDGEVRIAASWPRAGEAGSAEKNPPAKSASESAAAEEGPTPIALTEALKPTGSATRLGDALAPVLDDPTGGPLAGVIIVTDGVQNGGLDPLSIADRATALKAPLFTVGVGSTEPRRNARLQELIAPERAYPDDQATIRALVSAEGLAGQRLNVELVARQRQGNGAAGAETRIGLQTVDVAEDAAPVAVEFPFTPAEVGTLELEARVTGAAGDEYAADDQASAEMVVVESSSKVLLVAGSASRDYRFLRNQLFRDRHAKVDVLLQSAPEGISQESNRILADFPAERTELFDYDCIVGFDPDWTKLDAAQVDLVEEWVANEAGGLIVVAGPVNTATWVQSPEQAKIRGLYPVEFQRRLTLMDDGSYGSKTPWPLDFTRAGEEADFLWLGETPDESRENWASFPGVFGCFAVKGAKPAATVYARYSDPDASITSELPVYFAEQFYGAGRVFYMGSGELWRLRAVDVKYFEMLTTQLVRHVSQGRLMRGSARGRLLVERDKFDVGEPVVVRAQLSTPSREPYLAPRVTARVVAADGSGRNVELAADAKRPGTFVGQFTPSSAGAYRIELPVPETLDEQLTRRIQAIAPDLEFRQTRRNSDLLAALAAQTGGRYYPVATTAATGGTDLPAIAALIPSRAETKTLRGKPDPDFTERLNTALLAVICGTLLTEWLLRRLFRLA